METCRVMVNLMDVSFTIKFKLCPAREKKILLLKLNFRVCTEVLDVLTASFRNCSLFHGESSQVWTELMFMATFWPLTCWFLA